MEGFFFLVWCTDFLESIKLLKHGYTRNIACISEVVTHEMGNCSLLT